MSHPFVHFQAAGLTWQSRDSLREPIEQLCTEGALGGSGAIGEVVKRSQNRLVTRMRIGDIPCYLKRYRVVGCRERLKFAVQPSRAEREWDAALRLRELGIPAVEPLAMGVARQGTRLLDAYFVSAETVGVRFDEAVTAELCAGRSTVALTHALIDLHQHLLSAGVFHPDLHSGNVLVDGTGTDSRIRLVGLHTLRFGRSEPLPAAKRRMRSKLAHSLSRVLDPSDFESALEHLAPGKTEQVKRDVENVERRWLATRSRRCIRESSAFTRDRAQGFTVWRRREVPLEQLMEATREESTQPLELSIGGRQVLVRTLRRQRGFGMLEWKGAHALAVRGIPAPTAFACLTRRSLGFSRETILVMEDRSAGLDITHAVRHGTEVESEIEQAIVEIAHRHHRAGLRLRPSDLVAFQHDGRWRLERRDLAVRPTDRPVSPGAAKDDLDRLIAAVTSGSP
ncbi:lipopolysaccharide kinase InaA family protein [Myxococcota bacterium]|nr:lipopolysaccharide kinase InaA family protein [Myxococcota bacterium]